jgi:hypothetical protein
MIMYLSHTTIWTHSNQKTNVYCSNEGCLHMYVCHHPTIHMLLLKLKIPPENAHNRDPVKKYSL